MSNTPTPRSFSRYPAMWIAAYFACGIAIERSLDVGIAPVIAMVATLCCVSAMWPTTARVLLPLLFIPLGVVCFQINDQNVTRHRVKRIYSDGLIASHEPVEIEGVLMAAPEASIGGAFLRLRVERARYKGVDLTASGTVRLFAVGFDEAAARRLQDLDLRYGSRMRVMCRLEREERFLNPGGASRIAILDEQGIDATATIKSPRLIEKIGDEAVFVPLAWVYARRQSLITAFRESFSDVTAGVMIASLLGDKHFLDRETAEVFRDGGTFHVLVISGLHITFIGGITLWLVSFVTKRKSWQILLSAGFLWAYTLAVGAEIPVVRASIMFSILLFARIVYRTASLVNALGFCTLLLLVWRPSDLFSASFQLTFVSVAAIVGFAVPLVEKLRAIGRWMPTVSAPLSPIASRPLRRFCEFLYWNDMEWRIEVGRQIWSANLYKSPYLKWLTAPNLRSLIAYVFEALLVSLIVQVSMLPLMVVYFHRVSPAAVFLNLWVGVFIALESFAALVAIFLNSFSSWLAVPLILLTEFLNSTMMFLPSRLSEAAIAGIRVPIYSGIGRGVYIVFAISITIASVLLFKWDPFVAYRRSMRVGLMTSLAVTLAAGAVIVFHPYSAPGASGNLQIDFLDVGQGDSALVTFPSGETMLVDGGGRVSYSNDAQSEFEPDVPRIGEAVVSEFLWERGYSRVDYLVVTHADADHIQGLVDVARNFQVGCVLVGRVPLANPEFESLRSVLMRRSIPVRSIARGDDLFIGGAEIEILNPVEDIPAASSNNWSVVIRIGYGSRKFLLTGDIESQAESDIVNSVGTQLRADLIKVAHHGSRTSSTGEFVEHTKPGVAVISVGRRSRFGHPHREIVERWRLAGANVLTTGEKGTITVSTDGRNLEIRTFLQ